MKKLLIVLLVVAMTLTLASVAFGATVNTYMGGRFWIEYRSNTPSGSATMITENKAPWSSNDTMVTMNWSVKAESGNSFAKVQWLNEVWANPISGVSYSLTQDGTTKDVVFTNGTDSKNNNYLQNFTYSFGQNNIGDMFDWQYNTGAAITTIGFQAALNSGGQWGCNGIDTPGQYDPMWFNRPKDVFAFGLHTDSFKANLEYGLNKMTKDGKTDNAMVFTGIVKFDAGDVHFGYSSFSDICAGASYIVGTKLKFEGLGTLLVDYYDTKPYWAANDTAIFQANMGLDELKMNGTLFYNIDNGNSKNNYLGLGFNYNGIEKIGLGLKYFMDDGNNNKKGYDVNATYNVGAFNVRAGYAARGAADPYFYLGAFGAMW